MDARRWSNVLSVERAFRSDDPRPGGGPREAYIEVAARCNLRCIMCPITVDPRYQPGSGFPGLLPPEQFERLEPVFSTLQRAHLFGLGEPLLNPHLFDYAERLSRAGVQVWTTTNATLIDDDTAERFVESGFDRVAVSIDGATKETYEAIRKRGRWGDLMRGLTALGKARQRHGRPYLVLSMVGMVSNFPEIPRLVELAAEVGADEVFVEVIYDWPHPDLHEVYRREHVANLGEERVRELVTAGRERAAELGLTFTSRLDDWGGDLNRKPAGSEHDPPLPGQPEAGPGQAAAIGGAPPPETPDDGGLVQIGTEADSEHHPGVTEDSGSPHRRELGAGNLLSLRFPCSEPWTTINVSAAGEVRTCCFNNVIYGSLATHDIDAIWNGQAYTDLRRLHAERRSPRACDDCVRSWRVKRSSYLLPREAEADVPPAPGEDEPSGGLDTPADGELVCGPLVVTGRLPRRSRWWGLLPAREPAVLPEVFLDGQLLARVADSGVIDGDRFALVVPADFVSEGSHLLTLRAPVSPRTGDGGAEVTPGASWGRRQIQLGRLDDGRPGATLVAVQRLAFFLELTEEERRPDLTLDGRPHELDAWICGTYGNAWRGVGVVDLTAVPPGVHELELRLRRHSAYRRRLHRLAVAHEPMTVPAG